MTLRKAGNHISGTRRQPGPAMGMAEGLAVAGCRAWCAAVFPRAPALISRPGPRPAGRGFSRQARAASGSGRQAGQPEGRVGASAKAASRALQAGDRRRRIFCLKLMRKVARPIVIGAGTWLLGRARTSG